MTSDAHADDGQRLEPGTPAGELFAASRRRAAEWLTTGVVAAARRCGVSLDDDPELGPVVDAAVERLLHDLEHLLRTDVDAQRTNPLSLFRSAVVGPNRWLLERGVRPPGADPYVAERFADDVFGLGPATWSDIHPDLHEPGIAWGAWKALTVLRRRHDEGRR